MSKQFGGVTAVGDITFRVASGSITGLLGGNGAGKTTTISMLLGLLLPSAGRVHVLGVDVAAHRHRVLPRMNFSSPYVELPRRLSVRENLTVYANLYGIDNVRERVARVADDMDIQSLLKRATGTLSAGQRTRVALAKAMLNRPEVLLLDEPTASLDPDTADWARARLEDYNRQTGATILMASHNMAEVERMCDQVLMMRDGDIVDRGTPAGLLALYDRDNLEDVFLDIARHRHKGRGDHGDGPDDRPGGS